jgi:hypothetical protein
MRTGRTGRHGALAFTRSHSIRTVKSDRVRKSSTRSTRVARPLAVAMPRPQIRLTLVSGGSERRQRSTVNAASRRSIVARVSPAALAASPKSCRYR